MGALVAHGFYNPFVGWHLFGNFVLDKLLLRMKNGASGFVHGLLAAVLPATEQALFAIALAFCANFLTATGNAEVFALAGVFYFSDLLDVALQMADLAATAIAAAVLAAIGQRAG